MRFVVALACAWSIQVCQGQQNLVADTLERDVFYVRPIPEVPVPSFADPLPEADHQRFDALYQELFKSVQSKWKLPDPGSPEYGPAFSAAMTNFAQNLNQEMLKFFQARVDAAAAQYGTKDPRYLAALEEAGGLLAGSVPEAASFLDKAIQLREPEGSKSVAYWKDLQRKCLSDMVPVLKDLSACERALEVRMTQPDATPLELASRAQILSGYESIKGNHEKSEQYLLMAAEYYEKVGVSPLVMARMIRGLAQAPASWGDSARILRLNDLTNHYLALGDAAAKKAMLPSETLKLLEEERHAPPPPTVPRTANEQSLTADQILDRYAEVERTLQSGRVVKPIAFDVTTLGQVAQNMIDPAGACARIDERTAATQVGTAYQRSQAGLDDKLASSSANSLASASIIQYVCGAAGALREGSPGRDRVPGYAGMAYSKGVFTEMAAPRKMTVLPGYGKERTAAIEALPDARAVAGIMNPLPPDEQRRIASLSKEAQEQAMLDYVKDHPEAAARPAIAERVKKMLDPMSKAYQLMREASEEEVNPLGFLDLLQPHEAFIDVYKYRAHEGDHFGAEHYVAVISAKDVPSRAMQLGPAEPIDTAVNAFLQDFVGGASESRGVRILNSGKSGRAEAWKTLQHLIVQPLIADLPKGTMAILLSPDSSFALVPFASLMLDMGIQASISIVPSAYDFARLRNASTSTGARRALVVGALDYGIGSGSFNRLPGTEPETRKVAELATSAGFQTIALSGSQATRAAILERIPNTQLLHLATHGFWSSAKSATLAEAFRGAGVALSLANSGTPETRLTADDILHLDLSGVQLVTLSACTSGQGRPVDGQGLLGFQTAFMAAGAHTLLLSLWSVPDEATSVLMQNFYQALWATPSISKSQALRRAQEQLRSDPAFADPQNWAAWVLVGEAW